MNAGLPILGVRVAEGRCGTTLLMQLLATSPAIVFDDRYPSEYRFASYFARVSQMMTEPFDEQRHPGVTSFFFDRTRPWGPVPFRSDVVDIAALGPALLRSMWVGWSEMATAARPEARYYAEKLAVPVDSLIGAGLHCRVIDLVRDPRDMLASIRSFNNRVGATFGHRAGQSEHDYVTEFIQRIGTSFQLMLAARGNERILVRYEDLVGDLHAVASSLGDWLDVILDADSVLAGREDYEHHMTTSTPQESVGRWRRDLSSDDAELITSSLEPLLTALGYPT